MEEKEETKQEQQEDVMTLYKLYSFAVQEREEYGDKYGDTDELMQMYEEKLEENGINVREQ